MKWVSKHQDEQSRTFEIKLDTNAGYYFYVYKNGIDTHDYLQDTLQFAKEDALEFFSVPMDSWVQVE